MGAPSVAAGMRKPHTFRGGSEAPESTGSDLKTTVLMVYDMRYGIYSEGLVDSLRTEASGSIEKKGAGR